MAVAKTYAKMAISGDPFEENGRLYVNVVAPKGLKKVRWYSDAEYKRMYPEAVLPDIMMTFNARHAFGFGEKGYITLYKGIQEDVEDWARASWPPKAWHNLTFGYYTPSDMDIVGLPSTITPIKLTWNEVKQDDIHMKSHEEVKRYVDNLLIGVDAKKPSVSASNQWIQKTVTIRKKETKEGHFGTKHTYTMLDAENNTYVWETGARDYQVDVEVTLKMKIKEIKDTYIVVWYCKEAT